MERLKNKRVAIIGAGSVGDGIGNGRAIAMLFAREGARVLAADRNLDAAQNTVSRITHDGGTAQAFAMDATDPIEVNALVERANALWGGIDILVHVVGMSLPGGVCETDPDDWDRVFAVNLKSAYLAARAIIPGMKQQGGGAIVFLSSLVATYSGPYSYVAYEASKAGMNRMGRSIARAHAPDNIRANVIMPGMIDTPHVTAFISDAQRTSSADRAAAVPMGRQGTAWDIAEAALFLSSDASSYITGISLPVDGGLGA
jgi:NAD(P)-dependent dehydrogenase (short-subunit alcohol dehydrogenase family)